jgi:TPP-dependent pyruvate/acetoin dehydrogenase alpha subunit
MAVWRAAGTAIARAREGLGTTLIEAKSYRLRGHIEAEAGFLPWKYRTDEEVAEWTARDPIPAFAAQLRGQGLLTDAALAKLDAKVLAEVAEAVRLADQSAAPEPSLLWSLVTARAQAAGV